MYSMPHYTYGSTANFFILRAYSTYIYRRMGFKCVVKCLRLRENKLIAFPIIAIADDLSHIHAHPVHVVLGSNNFLRSNDCESGKNSQFAIISRSQTFPVLRYISKEWCCNKDLCDIGNLKLNK